ncbi:MAG TPA: hypothetical protein VGI70_20375 [Polyangiales bacterium]
MALSLDRRARKLVDRIRKDHRDFDAIEALAAHYAKGGDQASLANLMQGFADTLEDARAAADAYVRAADAALFLNDPARASLLYERALAREPSHAEAIDRALRVAEARCDFEAMRRILSGAIRALEARAGDRKQLAALHFRLGQLLDTHFLDSARAIASYRIALENNPQFVNAIVALRRLYEQSGDDEAVSTTYRLEIETCKLPEDQRALLMTLAEHEHARRHDLDRAIEALRRACRIAPPHLPTLRQLADRLVERSERSDSEVDLKRAAEVYFQAARSVPRAEAAPLLLRALALAPEHARAQALLQELHRHAADGGERSQLFSGVPQREIDERSTRQLMSPLGTTALGTGDLLAVQEWTDANRTIALSTAELIPLPLPPIPPPMAAAPMAAAPIASDPPMTKGADRTIALSTGDWAPLRSISTPPPIPTTPPRAVVSVPVLQASPTSTALQLDPPPAPPADPVASRSLPTITTALHNGYDEAAAPTRARIVDALEPDPTCLTIEVNLGAATESNLYVDMGDRIADGGVFVATYQALPTDTPIELHITLPGGLHTLAHGLVTLRRDSLDAFEDPAPGICIAFEALSRDGLDLLQRFAAKRTPWLIDDR